jgi:preprotein translocase subunit SecE
VARNRKRAKERRSRRPASSQVSRPGVATARADREAHEIEAPSPLEHATPDVELADAQLAVGRPDLVADRNGESPASTRDAADESVPDEPEVPLDEESVIDEPEVPLDEQEFEDEEDFADEAMASRGGGDGGGRVGRRSGGSDGGDGGGGELAVPAAGAPAQRRHAGNRLINFLQGSWRELQRVQWPDRRQVMQATGVVIGFVIVAGVYLGVADSLAGKLMNFILK